MVEGLKSSVCVLGGLISEGEEEEEEERPLSEGRVRWRAKSVRYGIPLDS